MLRRSRWTNRLAWAVWLMRKKNKERKGGVTPPPPESLWYDGDGWIDSDSWIDGELNEFGPEFGVEFD